MSNRTTIIDAIQRYAEESGLKPSSIGQMAVRNSRLYGRSVAAEERDAKIAERILQWISDHRSGTEFPHEKR